MTVQILLIVLFGAAALAGVWMVAAPRSAWRADQFGKRWQYKDRRVEASDAGLAWMRVKGCIVIVGAIGMMVYLINLFP